MKNIFKRTLAIFLIALAFVSVVAISASASDFESTSTMVMVDPNTHKTASTFYLYGKADYICLKMKNDRREQGDDFPTFELYSDSKYKKMIARYQQGDPSDKTAYITLSLDLSNIKSGTYYAKTYIEKLNSYTQVKDESTEKTYKIVIKKGGTTMTDMNTVMYGYENTQKGPKIYWFSVPDATGYYVYRRNPDTKKYEKIKTVKDKGEKFCYYTDTDRKDMNSTDYYKVVAYKGSKKTPLSLKELKATVLKTPVITVEPNGWKKVKIAWSKVKSGAKYTVLKRTKDSEWSEVCTTTSTAIVMSFDDDITKSNDVYYFTVVANVKGVFSGYNVKGKAFRYLDEPKLNPCTYPDEGGITVNWNLVEGADQYAIYKKNGKKWTEIALVDGDQTSYTDTTVDAVQGATYTVCSMVKGAYKYYSASGVKGIKFEKLILNEVVEEDGSLKISWTNPLETQSCSYKIYYKGNGGDTHYLCNTSDSYYTFTPSRSIITYEFNVCATKNGVVGPANDIGVFYTYYPKMYSPQFFATQSSVEISWNTYSNVDGYVLYKKTADGEYVPIVETTENKYIDTDVENDVSYSYKLAYKHDGKIITEKESEEVTKIFVDEKVNFVDETYEISGSKYYIKIDNFEENCSYRLYRKVENEWQTVPGSIVYLYKGEISIPDFSGEQEFAILKTCTDGRMTRLPENGFIVDYDGCANEVEMSTDRNVVTFSWNPETLDAQKVFVYRNSNLLQVVDASEGVFVDTEAVANEYNNYKILTQKGNFVSLKSATKKYSYLGEPTYNVAVASSGLRIYWDDIEVPCKCVIYKMKADGSGWQKLKTCKSSAGGYTDTKVKSGEINTYTVRLLDSDGNYGPYDEVGKSSMYLDVPEITKIKSNANSVTINWTEVPEAKSYTLKFKSNGKWVYVKDIPAGKTTYTDKTIVSGTKRYYYVSACNGEYQSLFDKKQKYFVAQPEITNVKSTGKSIRIEFSKVEGATDYDIYYKVGNSSEWRLFTNTKKNYYVDNVQPGTKYTYSVAAVWRRSGGYKTVSTYDKKGKVAKALATPALDEVISKKAGITVSWGWVSGATGYNVYRKTADSSWEKIAYVKGGDTLSYVDKTAKKGKTYTYTVSAKYGATESKYNKTGLTCKDKY